LIGDNNCKCNEVNLQIITIICSTNRKMKLNIGKAMDLAEIWASLSDRKKHKTGCVILDRGNRVISAGSNSDKTHPTQWRYARKAGNEKACHLHAEIAAIIKLRDDDQPYSIFVTRLLHHNERSMAKPCPICQAALLDVGISQVYFTNKNGDIEKMY